MKRKLVTLDIGAGGLGLPNTERAFRSLWEALDELEQAVHPANIFRVVIFGSGRIPPEHRIYAETKEMAYEIAKHGPDIVTGGGPGAMAAANEGAMMAMKENPRAWSHGVCIEQINRDERPNEFLKRMYKHRFIISRLHAFIRLLGGSAPARNGNHVIHGAVILAEAGGYGTDLEKGLLHQLLQFRQMNVPLIGIGPMWRERAAWEKKWIIDPGWALPSDLTLMQCVDKPMDAVPIVLNAYRQFKLVKAAG